MDTDSVERDERVAGVFNIPEKAPNDNSLPSKIPLFTGSSGKKKSDLTRKSRKLSLGPRISEKVSDKSIDKQSEKNESVCETKFKREMLRLTKDLKDMEDLKKRAEGTRKNVLKLRQVMIDQFQKDPGSVPSVETSMIFDGGSSTDIEQAKVVDDLKNQNNTLTYDLDDMRVRLQQSAEYLLRIHSELPIIEGDYQSMAEVITNTERKQDILESSLENFKADIANVLNTLNTMKTFKANAEHITLEMEFLQNELQKQKEMFYQEIKKKDEEVLREFLKRKTLEENLVNMNTEKISLQENCKKLIEQVDTLKEMSLLTQDECFKDSNKIDQTSKEMEELNNALLEAKETIILLNNEKNELVKKCVQESNEKEKFWGDLEKMYQQCLFHQENQIFHIKSQMEEKVQLKKFIESKEFLEKPIDLKEVMQLNDCIIIKTEVVRLHNMLAESLEERRKLEEDLKGREEQITVMDKELDLQAKTITNLDNLVSTLKQKDKINDVNMAAFQQSLKEKNLLLTLTNPGTETFPCNGFPKVNVLKEEERKQEHYGECDMAKVNDLLVTIEKYKTMVASVERQLNDLEVTHLYCAERRTRNEQRIALLEINLAKYE